MNFNISTASDSNRVQWESNDNQLPLTKYRKGLSLNSIFMIAFGSLFAIIPVLFIFFGEGTFETKEWVILSVFFLFGSGIELAGIYLLLQNSTITINQEEVSFIQTGLRSKQWRLPLSDYQGILKNSIIVQRNKSSYTLHQLVLKHPNEKDKDVTLYQVRSDQYIDEQWEKFASLLKLPGLEETLEGLRSTKFGETRSLKEEAPESYAKAVSHLPDTLGKVTFSREGGKEKLSFYRGNEFLQGIIGSVICSLFVIFPLWIYLYQDRTPFLFIFIGFGALMTLCVLAHSICILFSHEELIIDSSQVKYHVTYPWGPQWVKTIPTHELQDISLISKASTQNAKLFYLTIESPQTTIQFNAPMSDDHKILVKNYLKTKFNMD